MPYDVMVFIVSQPYYIRMNQQYHTDNIFQSTEINRTHKNPNGGVTCAVSLRKTILSHYYTRAVCLRVMLLATVPNNTTCPTIDTPIPPAKLLI